MPGSTHALLSPSSAHMWMACTPSAKFSSEFPDQESPYAKEGTDAHSLCEFKLKKALGLDAVDPRGDLGFYDAEMEACSDDYAPFVLDTLSKLKETCPDPMVMIEQKLDLSAYIPSGYGYGDCVIVADGQMHVVDFKYGLGVMVEAEGNPQMLCYALGALELVDSLYDINTISMTVFQPRRENVSTWTLSREELLSWANEKLVPAAKLAIEGKGDFVAGEHCRFCKAKAVCRARAELNLELARYDFQMPQSLDDTEIAAILGRLDALVSWADDIKEYALKEALSGKHYDGFKVVEGRSVRKYTSEDEAAKAVTEAGYDPYEKKVYGITAMTALLGRKRFEEVLGSLVYKAPGKPTLVDESDKRPTLDTAKEDFKTVVNEEENHDKH
ncbi:MAG: DUF2800 domain-containing protein [Sphaerochaetaceae bacterium]